MISVILKIILLIDHCWEKHGGCSVCLPISIGTVKLENRSCIYTNSPRWYSCRKQAHKIFFSYAEKHNHTDTEMGPLNNDIAVFDLS